MSSYETMVLLAPTLGPDAVDRLIKNFEEVITSQNGTVNNVVKWGRRQLAYEINKYKEGIYTIFEYNAPGDLIKEFERRLRLNDSILRYLTVKTDRKIRLEEKGTAIRKARQEKSKRKGPRPAPPSGDRMMKNKEFDNE